MTDSTKLEHILNRVSLERIKEVSHFDNREMIEVALSVECYNDTLYGISRRLDLNDENSPSSGWRSDLMLKELNDQFEEVQSEFITKGEDPRMFVFRNELMSITWVWNAEKRDLDMYLVNCNKGTKTLLHNLDIPFNGKNWVPYIYDDSLYFIYSLEPLIILKFMEPNLVMLHHSDVHPEKLAGIGWGHGVGNLRAGSKGIQFGEMVYLFSRTASPGPHIIHFTILDHKNHKLYHKNLEPHRNSGVHDPYGFFQFGGKYYLSTTESDTLWGPQATSFSNSIYLIKNLLGE
jgi:hypothetical protein